MVGKIVATSNKNGFVMVETDYGYTVFEPMGSYDINLGDELKGDLDSDGDVTLRNLRTNELMEVYVQEIQCSKEFAINLLNR